MPRTPTKLRRSFGQALRQARRARGLTQEDFAVLSSRTYVSSLERGVKSPTLDKIVELAETMKLHPLTLLGLAYQQNSRDEDSDQLWSRVFKELTELKALGKRR